MRFRRAARTRVVGFVGQHEDEVAHRTVIRRFFFRQRAEARRRHEAAVEPTRGPGAQIVFAGHDRVEVQKMRDFRRIDTALTSVRLFQCFFEIEVAARVHRPGPEVTALDEHARFDEHVEHFAHGAGVGTHGGGENALVRLQAGPRSEKVDDRHRLGEIDELRRVQIFRTHEAVIHR